MSALADWWLLQQVERRAERLRLTNVRIRRERQVYRLRYLRLLEAIEAHRSTINTFPAARDDADARLWRRLKDGR